MLYAIYIVAIPILALLSTLIYRSFNKGLSSSARHQQLTRLSIASAIALAPSAIAAFQMTGILPWLTALLCATVALTYPLLYHLSYRATSPDYDNFMDIALGLYLYGLLSALQIAGDAFGIAVATNLIVAIVDICLLLALIFQWGYYLLYGNAIDVRGMKIFYETHYNEVIEFGRSFSPARLTIFLLLLVAVIAAIVATAFIQQPVAIAHSTIIGLIAAAAAVAISFLTFSGRHSPWRRCGLVSLYLDVKDFNQRNRMYLSGQRQRLESLDVEPLGKHSAHPSTILLVIGESASRDHMSAFTPMDRDTTPWLSDMARNHGCILFKNSYSCAMHTVEALERALTQRNQYNNLPFLDAPSIVDIAHKLGYRVHWYSNQGHLGANDTSVSLIAETADVARWTHQQLGKVQYDHTLLDFLDELDPSRDNFLVVHLKGSHFNFLNRYPAEATVWGTPGVQDDAINYLNSIRYTDGVLHKIYNYCVDSLNLQAMVYFSDHATVPDRHRSPNFDGFGHVRIPLAVWLSDEYRANHPYRASALQANADKYFTNDLAFELLCGLLDIRSSAFDESASLASETYRFSPADLLTYNATIPITADPTPKP